MDRLRSALNQKTLETLLSRLDMADQPFDPHTAYYGPIPCTSPQQGALRDCNSYQQWFKDWIETDLANARRGVRGSPFKAALEIVREFRDTIRYAVDHGGLSDESLDRFFGYHSEMINRIVVGPQKERNEDICALISPGILSIP